MFITSVVKTYFQHKDVYEYSWHSCREGRRAKSTSDMLLVRQEFVSSVHYVRSVKERGRGLSDRIIATRVLELYFRWLKTRNVSEKVRG